MLLEHLGHTSTRPEVGGEVHERFERLNAVIVLFNHELTALTLNQSGIGLTAIGKQLGITKRRANLAVNYGRAMRNAGQTDPFTELTARPANASRWRKGRYKADGDQPQASDEAA